jgi:hypothetical protein
VSVKIGKPVFTLPNPEEAEKDVKAVALLLGLYEDHGVVPEGRVSDSIKSVDPDADPEGQNDPQKLKKLRNFIF